MFVHVPENLLEPSFVQRALAVMPPLYPGLRINMREKMVSGQLLIHRLSGHKNRPRGEIQQHNQRTFFQDIQFMANLSLKVPKPFRVFSAPFLLHGQ